MKHTIEDVRQRAGVIEGDALHADHELQVLLLRDAEMLTAYADLLEASRALVEAIDAASPHLASVCQISQIHGFPYAGPQFSDQLAALRRLLPAPPETPTGQL